MTFSCKPHYRQLFKESVRGVVAYAAKGTSVDYVFPCVPILNHVRTTNNHSTTAALPVPNPFSLTASYYCRSAVPHRTNYRAVVKSWG